MRKKRLSDFFLAEYGKLVRYVRRLIDDDNHDDDPGKSKGSHRNWQYYKQYWQDEGKAAFEAYIDRLEAEEEK